MSMKQLRKTKRVRDRKQRTDTREEQIKVERENKERNEG